MARGVRRADFADHIRTRLRTLKGTLERRETVVEAIREANATLDRQKVAAWLVRKAHEWLPAPCWVVVGLDVNGQPSVLADRGLVPEYGPSIWAAANRVLGQGTALMVADLSADLRVACAAAGAAVAFPLICRTRTVGALIGFDPMPSATVPSLGQPVLAAFADVLEPVAIALDNAVALQRAEALSVTDDLTGLYNSRYLNLVLRREEKRANRSGRPLSLLFIDMDGFRDVNTRHGHLAGSKALVEAAAVIRNCARETDVVARFGGDEFSVVLPDTGREGAMYVAERVCERLRAFRFLESDGPALHLTASVGIATLPDSSSSAEDLLRAADRAMYRAKDSGKDGIQAAEKGI